MSLANDKNLRDYSEEPVVSRGNELNIVLFTPYVRRLLIAALLLWLTTYHEKITGYFDPSRFPQQRIDNILYTVYGIVGSIITYELVKWFAD